MMRAVRKERPGAMCVICGKPAGKRHCSRECRLISKVLERRSKRPLKDHACECKVCGRQMRAGRPRRILPNELGQVCPS
jgi:hypothetical protein